MVKYMTSIEGATKRNCLQFMGQGQKKIVFERETRKSHRIIDNLKMGC